MYETEQDLTELESRLVPKLELAPRLEGEFERLHQNLQDAVAAQDKPHHHRDEGDAQAGAGREKAHAAVPAQGGGGRRHGAAGC